GDPGPAIGDAQLDLRVAQRRRHLDLALARHAIYGVAQEVRDHLLQLPRVAEHGPQGLVQLQADAPLEGRRALLAAPADGLADDVVDRQHAPLGVRRLAREAQQRLDDPLAPERAALDLLQVLLALVGRDLFPLQDLREGQDAAERVVDLVRDAA